MASHVILFAVVVDNRRFRVVVLAVFSDSVVELVGPFAYGLDHFWDFGLHVGVLPLGPVVLIAHVGPSYLLVEMIPLRFFLHFKNCSLLGLLLRLLLFFHCLGFFLVELVAAVEVGPVGLFAEGVEGLGCNVEDSLWRVELLDQDGSFGIGQMRNQVPINILILLWLVYCAEVRGPVVVQFEVLLHLLEGIQVLVLRLGVVLIFSLAGLFHVSFILTRIR